MEVSQQVANLGPPLVGNRQIGIVVDRLAVVLQGRLEVASLDEFGEPALSAITTRLERDEATAPEELRLFRARLALRRGERADADFVRDDPPRFRTDPDVGSPRGPDPRSPVRDADLRNAVLDSCDINRYSLTVAMNARMGTEPQASPSSTRPSQSSC